MSTNPFALAADPFDSLLTKVCSVWKKGATGAVNAYGLPYQNFSQIADQVPCFVESTSGKVLNTPPASTSETSYAVKTYRIFMRLLMVDNPPIALSENYWLQIKNPGDQDIDPNSADSKALMHKITYVDDIGLLGHHLEVDTTVIEP